MNRDDNPAHANIPELETKYKHLQQSLREREDCFQKLFHASSNPMIITDRINAEEELKQSKEYLNEIINCLGDPIFVKDEQHRFMLVNDDFCAFSGRTREELIGQATHSFLPEKLARSLSRQEKFTFDTGPECVSEEIVPDGQGRLRTMMSKRTLLRNKAGHKQIVAVLRDIQKPFTVDGLALKVRDVLSR